MAELHQVHYTMDQAWRHEKCRHKQLMEAANLPAQDFCRQMNLPSINLTEKIFAGRQFFSGRFLALG
jgi:predicted transcriptional regulator